MIAVGTCAGVSVVSAGLADPAVIAAVERVVHGEATPEVDAGIRGLRRLRDPVLRPLFSAMVDSADPVRRRHGVLGLAELESPPRLNPLTLSRVADHFERASILGEAMRLSLVGPSEVQGLLMLPSLDPYLEAVLRCRLARDGGMIDEDRVAALASTGSLPTELLGAALLAQAGKGDRLMVVGDRLVGLDEPVRGAHVGPFLEVVSRERLRGASMLLARLEPLYQSDAGLHADVLRAWMRASPSASAAAWQRAFAEANEPADRLRLALTALDAAMGADPAIFQVLTMSDDPLLSSIGRACVALASGVEADEALVALISLRYRPVELWASDRASEWPAERALAVRRAIISASADRERLSDPVSDAAASAAEALATTDPRFLGAALARACDRRDTPLATAILAGLLRAGAPPPWDVGSPPSWPDRRCEAVALLVRARCAGGEGLLPDLLADLTDIATGRSVRLPEAMRVQAAWLVIQARGEGDVLLARILAGGT